MAVASLGMYDGGPLHAANDALWALIAGRLRESGVEGVPETLDRSRPLDDIWSDPGLLLGQCCGYPLMTRYRDRLRVIATPRYLAPGCAGAMSGSRIVVRAEDDAIGLADLRGRRAAINDRHSNTGMNLFRGAIAPLAHGSRFFAEVIETGAHIASLRAVAEGAADVAAIDAVTFEQVARHDPGLAARVRTIGWTARGPGLPFVTAITSSDALVAQLQDALAATLDSPAADMLLIEGFEILPADAYQQLLDIETEAVALGYRVLA